MMELVQSILSVIDTGGTLAILIIVVIRLYKDDREMTEEYIEFLKSKANGDSDK